MRLAPNSRFTGVAVVADSWPLLRAGVRQTLQGMSLRVAADEATFESAKAAVGDRLDLVVVGNTLEDPRDIVAQVRRLPGAGDSPPKIIFLLDAVDAGGLRHLLTDGVEGLVQRSIELPDLKAACERVLAGHRVVSGGPLSVLASAGLELREPGLDSDDRAGLTRKEREVLSQLAQHVSNKEIAERLHVSAATVKTHLSNIYGKLGVTSRREAVVVGVERGLLA
ncbi:response regulator transcription factor [Euzebya tangerina]|uniref:response regulator transcription factor n=1 Tax=Euzebya tangerina TaxID=591198 RepID=UPI000E31E404|nr:response regulator transcription factor [Euzebya tangerina]